MTRTLADNKDLVKEKSLLLTPKLAALWASEYLGKK